MKKKMLDSEKKITVSFSLNPYIYELLDKYIKKSKSKFIETLLKNKLKNNI